MNIKKTEIWKKILLKSYVNRRQKKNKHTQEVVTLSISSNKQEKEKND